MSALNSVISVLVESVSESQFWDFVRKAKWGSDHDYNRIKNMIMNTMTAQEAEDLREQFMALRSKLSKRIDAEVEGVGDDGYSDLLAHIIGSGKEAYEAVMKDPRIAQRIVDNSEFEESFSYSFPYKEDYRMMNDEWWKEVADNMLEELNSQEARDLVKNEEDAAILKDLITRYRLIRQGKYEKALRDWDRSKYDDYMNSNISRASFAFGPPNYLNDLEKFKIKQ